MPCPDTIIDRLRQQGHRLTLPRRHVIDVLCAHPDHLTVQDVHRHVQAHGIDLNETTIYRVLQWLKDAGLVAQTDLGRSEYVYQIISSHPHHHLVCLDCRRVIDLDDDAIAPLRTHLRTAHDFEPRIDHMAIFGLCGDCRRARESGAAPGDPTPDQDTPR